MIWKFDLYLQSHSILTKYLYGSMKLKPITTLRLNYRKFNKLFDLTGWIFVSSKLFRDLTFKLFVSETLLDMDCKDCVGWDDLLLNISVDLARTGFVTIQNLKAKDISDFRASHGDIWWNKHNQILKISCNVKGSHSNQPFHLWQFSRRSIRIPSKPQSMPEHIRQREPETHHQRLQHWKCQMLFN